MSTLDNTDLTPITRGVPRDCNDEAVPSQPSKSTLWRHARSRPIRKDKADSQQYLTPREERALLEYVLCMDERENPLPVKFLGFIAHVIKRRRPFAFQVPAADDGVRPPGKNWPQGFYKCHPELKARKVRPLDWAQHDIYDKVVGWLTVIGKELSNPAIVLGNVYNMDETGVLLSVRSSLKVLVSRQSLRNYRGTGVKRTLVTAIECISADGRCLDPLIFWPAATHCSTWTTHTTPGWHFACSKKGYTDTEISLYWIKHVFDLLTRARANHKLRILISNGFGTHKSPELLKFAFENNIILCQLGSHTSHRTPPCDVGPFGPLKTAYCEQAERLFCGGANMISKQHFILLYDRARTVAFTTRNINSG